MSFADAQAVEDAFYEAFEAADFPAMQRLWLPEGVCIHLMAPILRGADMLDVWRQMFSSGTRLEIEVQHVCWFESEHWATHIVQERIALPGAQRPPTQVLVTNGYQRTQAGWRMALHHASPPPPPRLEPGPQLN